MWIYLVLWLVLMCRCLGQDPPVKVRLYLSRNIPHKISVKFQKHNMHTWDNMQNTRLRLHMIISTNRFNNNHE